VREGNSGDVRSEEASVLFLSEGRTSLRVFFPLPSPGLSLQYRGERRTSLRVFFPLPSPGLSLQYRGERGGGEKRERETGGREGREGRAKAVFAGGGESAPAPLPRHFLQLGSR